MTPGVAPSPLNPQTPGAGMDSLSSQDWYTTDIEVRFKDSNSDAGLCGQVGRKTFIFHTNCCFDFVLAVYKTSLEIYFYQFVEWRNSRNIWRHGFLISTG